MKQLINLFILILGLGMSSIYAQPTLTATASSTNVCAGSQVTLMADYNILLEYNGFNNQTLGTGWSSTAANPVFTNPCGAGPVSWYAWVGTTGSQTRVLESVNYTLDQGQFIISWYMKYGIEQISANCEDPDDPNEGVHLQYSSNNGATWTDFSPPNMNPVGINSSNPPFSTSFFGRGGYWPPVSSQSAQASSTLYYWHQYKSVMIIPTNGTQLKFRFAQLSNSSTGFDAWGIDEVYTYYKPSVANYTWSTGDSTIKVFNVYLPPHPQNIAYDTCFVVSAWSSFNPTPVFDTICVTVHPQLNIDILASDTSFCTGDSILLQTQSNGPGISNWSINGIIYNNITTLKKDFPSGNYNVTLSVQNICGIDTATANFTYYQTPSSNFSANITSGCTPLNVQFTNDTTFPAQHYNWTFGDGIVANQLNPSHIYNGLGSFSVSLIAKDTINGCLATKTYPQLINVTCGSPCSVVSSIVSQGNGFICLGDSLLLSSGTVLSTYSYQWIKDGVEIPGATGSNFWAKGEGVYKLKITDNCIVFSPDLNVQFYPEMNPLISYIAVPNCFSDSAKLALNNSYTAYYWNNGDTTSQIWVNQTGIYTVLVTDSNGCSEQSAPFDYVNYLATGPQICHATFDNNLEKNVLYWQKDCQNVVKEYLILRSDDVNTQYQLVSSGNHPSTNFYIDTNSTPKDLIYSYYLKAIDNCLMQSVMSQLVTSTKLRVNSDLNNKWILSWNLTNLPISALYLIYRGTTKANLQLIDSVPASQNIYHDLSAPSGDLLYQIGYRLDNGCQINNFTPAKIALSNFISTTEAENLGFGNQHVNSDIKLFPNPNDGRFVIAFKDLPNIITGIQVFNLAGEKVFSDEVNHDYSDEIEVSLDKFSTGIYFVLIYDQFGICDLRKVIIQNN
ncbi:MAG: T9SS type A sorting domain-containing protein [Bacteroidales bacterium]|nr:T9SS type A sorting domain-containing protein [Bacteroidales bacterium]